MTLLASYFGRKKEAYAFAKTCPIENAVLIELFHDLHTGNSLLRRIGLPSSFPPVMAQTGEKIDLTTSWAISPTIHPTQKKLFQRDYPFKAFFYDPTEASDLHYFFWEYYLPLLKFVFGK